MHELRANKDRPELRTAENSQPSLEGYGATFERLSQNLGGFVEIIDPQAFTDTLRHADRNIIGAFNHDMSLLLATTDSGTLELGVDETGLRYRMSLDITDPDAQRVMAKVKAGKVRGSSFSFSTLADSWTTTPEGFPLRRLESVQLYELGPVSSPAYRSTEEAGNAVALRSLSQFVDLPYEQVSEAARLGTLDHLILRDVRSDVPDEEEPTEPETPSEPDVSTSKRTGRRNPPTR